MRDMSDSLPEAVYTAAQVRELDRIAIEQHGIPGYRLMQRAAEAALAELGAAWPEARALAIYCGAGNNAGDGYVLARLAAAAGYAVRVLAAVAPERLRGDAARAHTDCADAGVAIAELGAAPAAEPGDADVVVDALLGTGLDRPLEGRLADAVAAINGAGRPVLALDIPTGLHADTGRALGTPVAADLTVTFVGLKQGLFLGSAPDYVGRLKFSDLRVPADARGVVPVMRRLKPGALAAALPRRPRTAHKGAHGRLLLIGSDQGFGGAMRLAGEAALRAGAGLVYVATHPDNVGVVLAGRPELICRGCEAGTAPEDWLETADAIVIGPGLGRGAFARAWLERVRGRSQPLVVDADALNLLAETPFTRADWVITPHPGEAARLLGKRPADVQAERLASVRALAERYAATAVLKGAGTLVADAAHDDAAPSLCDRGNPGLATAGTGDVLAGVIGALLAQGLGPAAAARTGVLLHALAGDAAAAPGERGLAASDLFAPLRELANPV